MDSETKELINPTEAALPGAAGAPPVFGVQAGTRFYRARYRFYMALLIFVVVVGLPIVSIPALRHRLSGRIQTLREAMAGGKIKPAVAIVGENKAPFPEEYERKAATPSYPKLPANFAATQGSAGPIVSAVPIPRAPGRGKRTLSIPRIPEEAESQPAAASNTAAAATGQEVAGADAQPSYQQGQMEKEAYDFLLKSNPTVSGMVLGSNPSLHFKSWGALKREEDAYWVRLTFTSVPGNTDVEYIWQVKLLAKQITPLSYNARSLANP